MRDCWRIRLDVGGQSFRDSQAKGFKFEVTCQGSQRLNVFATKVTEEIYESRCLIFDAW